MCLGYSRRTNMGLGPCNADINPHAQPLSCCMHMMSHGLRCLCQGPGPFKQWFNHLHQVISSVSVQNSVQKSVHSPVHSPVQSPESRFYTNPNHKTTACHVLVYDEHVRNTLKQALVHDMFITWPGMKCKLIIILC